MGAGHTALALGASRFAPRLNAGWLIFAAMLCDFQLGVLASLGPERAIAPPDYPSVHYLWFTFPDSHGLVAVLSWSAIAGFLAAQISASERKTVFLVVAAIVFSHFVLDAAAHVSGLPPAGENSPKIGLGLWKNPPLELSLETLMAILGIALYMKTAGRRFGVPVPIAIIAVVTWGQMFALPKPADLVTGWILLPIALSGIARILDRGRLASGH